jgi:hypothetical protein
LTDQQTVPRIALNALKLAWIYKLSIWYRPEPKSSSIPRRVTVTENFISIQLLLYLQHVFKVAPEGTHVLVSCATHQQGKHLFGTHTPGHPGLQLSIHAPQFYRQVITYRSLSDFLSFTLLHPCAENQTAYSNSATALIESLKLLEPTAMHRDFMTYQPNLFWRIIRYVFKRFRKVTPIEGVYPYPGLPQARHMTKPTAGASSQFELPEAPHTDGTTPCSKSDGTGFTEVKDTYFLDDFVFNHCDKLTQVRYMVRVAALLLRIRIMALIGGE